MRILLVMLEFPVWLQARHWSYVANFAIQDGMRANGIETVVLPAFYGMSSNDRRSWLSRAKQLLDGQHFDQVWIWLVHNDYDEAFLDYLETLAPVRVGWLGENLFYTDQERRLSPELPARREAFFKQVRVLTHVVVAADEVEADYLERECRVPAIWWPTAVPRACIFSDYAPAAINQAVFCGSPYGMRKAFLQHDAVQRVLMTISPPENAYDLPDVFNTVCREAQDALAGGQAVDFASLAAFTDKIEAIRKEIFTVWLNGIRRYAVFVNLPSYGKCYTSRVVEAMAAGRPIVAWDVPGRPRNTALFKDGEDIFLYDAEEPEAFARRIEALVGDRERLEATARNARRKLLAYHTSETRIRQVMDWIETGQRPVFSDAERGQHPDVRPDTAFYVELFTHNTEWSAAEANADELARWRAIEAFVQEALPHLPGRPSLLEVGSGRGWLGDRLARYADYAGLEPVADVVRRAKALFPDRHFEVGSLDTLPADRTFDILVATEVIEHIQIYDQARFVEQLYARTKPGGYCIITTPRAELYQYWRHIVAPQPTEYWLDEPGLERLFVIGGFRPVRRERVYKTMPKLYAFAAVKDGFVAPDQVPLYQAWLLQKPLDADGQATSR